MLQQQSCIVFQRGMPHILDHLTHLAQGILIAVNATRVSQWVSRDVLCFFFSRMAFFILNKAH